jgi:hypothetical protein
MSRILVGLVVCLGLSLTAALAQEASSVVGTVTDQSGAVVADAKVTAANVGTGLSRTVTTSSTGDYVIPNLPVGTYKVTAEKSGFKLGVASDVHLDVQRAARVDFALELGQVTQQVNVTSVAPMLQTHDSQVGTLVENRRIDDLPLNGRNFTQLNLLVPGVVEGVPGDYVETYSLGTRGSGVSFAVNGQSANYDEYLLDGVPIKEVQHEGPGLSPSVDAIQEFRVQTSNYDAQFGTEAGGQINLVTKSGTNQFHGSPYEFLRNDAMDARNFFDYSPKKAELRRNQYGGTVGGPVKKDSTFFFLSYEGTRIRKGSVQEGLVPTADERSGNFSDLLPQGIQPLNPLNGQPFTGDQIPPGMLSSYATQILQKFVPLPNNPSNPVFNWISNDANRIGVDQGLARLDHRFSQSDILYGRFILEDVRNTSPKLFPTDSFVQDSRGQNLMLGYSHTFSSNKVNEFKMAYNRHRENEVVGQAFKENVGQELGLQGICDDPACWGIPDNYVGPFLDFGEHGLGQTVSGPRGWLNEIFHFSDAFYWTKGNHLIRFGMELDRNHDNFPEAIFPRGLFSYDGRFTSPDGSPNSSTALADFLLGLPRSSEASIDIFSPYFRNTALYPWFQDDWRVTRSLTLNLGISCWWFGRPQSKNNTIATLDFAVSPAQIVTAQDASQFGFPRALTFNDNNNVSPRVGFAWSPENHKRFVLRGGYGIFYQRASANNWIDIAINPPFVNQTNYILEPSAQLPGQLRRLQLPLAPGGSPPPILRRVVAPGRLHVVEMPRHRWVAAYPGPRRQGSVQHRRPAALCGQLPLRTSLRAGQAPCQRRERSGQTTGRRMATERHHHLRQRPAVGRVYAGGLGQCGRQRVPGPDRQRELARITANRGPLFQYRGFQRSPARKLRDRRPQYHHRPGHQQLRLRPDEELPDQRVETAGVSRGAFQHLQPRQFPFPWHDLLSA